MSIVLFFLNFNSTMVRLKAMVGATMQPDNTLFQFHYGTIKRSNYNIAQMSNE